MRKICENFKMVFKAFIISLGLLASVQGAIEVGFSQHDSAFPQKWEQKRDSRKVLLSLCVFPLASPKRIRFTAQPGLPGELCSLRWENNKKGQFLFFYG